jgi:hypothetical protein
VRLYSSKDGLTTFSCAEQLTLILSQQESIIGNSPDTSQPTHHTYSSGITEKAYNRQMDPATSFMRKINYNAVIGLLESAINRISKYIYREADNGQLPNESFRLFLASKKNGPHWNDWCESLENAYIAQQNAQNNQKWD